MKQKNTHTAWHIHGTLFVIWLMCIFCNQVSFAQYSLRLEMRAAGYKETDSIFVAGNFNGWNPADTNYRLRKHDDLFILDIKNLSAGNYQFKTTRGSWDLVEVDANGKDVSNREINLVSDSVYRYSVSAWKSDFAAIPKVHTASPQVSLLDSTFFSPQLYRNKRIWIYLPEGYDKAKNKKRYPVMYMQDGQNLFDEQLSGFGEWGVDECIDSLVRNGKPPCIVVGIEAGPKRINEYKPYEDAEYGAGEGDLYIDFLVNTLKPYIDKHYRTLKSKEHTYIAGSSLGGLISYYAILKRPDVFGNAGVFSPSFWIAPQLSSLTDSIGDKVSGKVFFYMGEKEGRESGWERFLNDTKDMAEELATHSHAVIYTLIDPEGSHNEKAWRKWFAEYYTWIMSDGFNQVMRATP